MGKKEKENKLSKEIEKNNGFKKTYVNIKEIQNDNVDYYKGRKLLKSVASSRCCFGTNNNIDKEFNNKFYTKTDSCINIKNLENNVNKKLFNARKQTYNQ